MGRWEPGASGRLRAAAMELYLERGYEQATVAEIAGRAGVTSRTFFRYFADKREVLFGGSELLQNHLVAVLEAAPPTATPMQAIQAAVAAAGDLIVDRDLSRKRHAVIGASEELRERELMKLTALSTALADALRRRGVDDVAANLTAETGMAVFRVAFDRWVSQPVEQALSDVVRESFDQLAVLTTPRPRRRATSR